MSLKKNIAPESAKFQEILRHVPGVKQGYAACKRLVLSYLGKYIIVAVGFDTGFINLASLGPSVTVHCFEPLPERFNELLKATKGVNNFHAHKLAVSNFDGVSKFYIGEDWGTDSLNKFVDNATDIFMKPFSDFENRKLAVKDTINVDVVRLDAFIQSHNIPFISYLHIDAQGEDLNVLKGLGDAIKLVEGGVIETITGKPCYEKQPTKQEFLNFLKENGFEIIKIQSQSHGMEENIFFSRKENIWKIKLLNLFWPYAFLG